MIQNKLDWWWYDVWEVHIQSHTKIPDDTPDDSFKGRPEILADMIRVYPSQLTYKTLTEYILKQKWKTWINKYFKKGKKTFTPEEIWEYNKLLSFYCPHWISSLRLQEEKKLIHRMNHQESTSQEIDKVYQTLLYYHIPIWVAIAQNYAQFHPDLEIEDIMQAWLMEITRVKHLFNGASKNRFASFFATYFFHGIQQIKRYDAISNQIPHYMSNFQNKATKILEEKEKIKQGELNWKERYETLKGIESNALIDHYLKQIENICIEYDDEKHSINEEHFFTPPELEYYTIEVIYDILKVLKGLTPKERDVLKMRFGLWNDQEHTIREIWRKLKIASSNVWSKEKLAIRKIRSPLGKKILGRIFSIHHHPLMKDETIDKIQPKYYHPED